MIKFGTGGWRAIIGEDFIMDNVRLLSQAIAIDSLSEQRYWVEGYEVPI
jgi:phosphomannomutase